MANYYLNNCKFYVGGLDASGYTNQGTLNLTKDQKDATTFASGGNRAYMAGMSQTNLALTALYDAATLDATFASQGMSTAQTVTVCPQTGNASDIAYSFSGISLTHERDFQTNEIAGYKYSSTGTSAASRSTILEDGSTARTSTGFGSVTQLGAITSTQTLYAALHVLSVAGTSSPTITVTVQSAAAVGFGTPHTQLTFTAATAVGGQWLTLPGANTDTYWRIGWTISGSSPSFSIVTTVGIN